MNWRRGVLLAALNIAVALPPIIWLEATETALLREHEQYAARHPPAASSVSSNSSGVLFPDYPCGWIDAYPPMHQEVVFLANLPAEILADWRDPCAAPAHWKLAGMLRGGGGASTAANRAANRKADIAFLLLIAVQWFLVGALPLRHPRRPWGEPGMFITICATLAIALVFIRPIDQNFAKFFGMLATLGWFWWFGLLVWKLARSAWKAAARQMATNRN